MLALAAAMRKLVVILNAPVQKSPAVARIPISWRFQRQSLTPLRRPLSTAARDQSILPYGG
jgi:hypothetical protein